jgi:DNA-binding XRE family transcriptional regulator
MNKLQNLLIYERKKLDYNKTQFAEYLGLTLSTIHRIEKKGRIGPYAIKKISKKINISVYELMEMKNEIYE